MKHLIPGLRKFSTEVYANRKPLFDTLSNGQSPHTLMITCSDSRIDPNLVTQTEPGELFVLRNAGNIIPAFRGTASAEESAIEFAIDGLKIPNIVVCGHSHCGAMAALFNTELGDKLPSVKNWLTHAEATKRRMNAHPVEEKYKLIRTVEENVLVQINNLKTHPSVSAALRDDRIQIYGWVYDFELGMVRIYDPKHGTFIPSVEVGNEMKEHSSRFAL